MTIRYRSVRMTRKALADAVFPEPLQHVLDALLAANKISGYEFDDDDVVVWGDLSSAELQLGVTPPVEPTLPIPDFRGEYFRSAQAYIHTSSFRNLPAQNRAIWRLHAQGYSHNQICKRISVSPMQVRMAVRGARLAAKLPAVTSSMPRGGGGSAQVLPLPGCQVDGCPNISKARGLCMAHYARRWREGKLKP